MYILISWIVINKQYKNKKTMKKQKLRIEELTINSFITAVPNNQKDTLHGGQLALESIVIAVKLIEATVTLNEISVSVVKSNLGGDCAGWSRLGCNGTGRTSPCDSMC